MPWNSQACADSSEPTYRHTDVLRAFALLGILVMNMPGFFASGW